MDFALLASDNLNLNNGAAAFSLQTPDAADGSNSNQKCYGFGFLRQERAINEEDLRELKMAKTCSSSSCGEGSLLRYPLQRSNGCNLSAEGHHQMLSFSSPNPQPTVALPYYPYTSNAFSRNAGINGGSMQQKQQGVGMGLRGPFTPSQWMELEHQALIYKYITANVPIPSYLLTPIRKAFESAGFSALRSNPLGLGGWSGFQLGFSNNDPEPGRCRRTDGKKWRCSRDAVIDQKYCERHMNRGRHRSRKPVEPQSNPSTISRGKQNENGGRSEYQHTTTPTLTMAATSPKVKPKAVEPTAFQLESARQEFGLVCSDSLLNPLNRSSTLVGRSSDSKSQHALRQFMEECPKNQPGRSAVDLQPDRTQLSISIPMVTSDFMSSTSSPANDKLTTTLTACSSSSPPQELEMGLGVGNVDDHDHDHSHRQTNWVPISWERSSIGGPLGEVLHNTNNSSSMGDTKQLNLIDRWDNSPRMATSPTGVLQRGAFASLSNSSAASSPRLDSSNHCIGFINPSLPAL